MKTLIEQAINAMAENNTDLLETLWSNNKDTASFPELMLLANGSEEKIKFAKKKYSRIHEKGCTL